MSAPTIPVSWGELFDRMSILEIKTQRLRVPRAVENAARELAVLRQSVCSSMTHPPVIAELRHALLAVNVRLWRIEDRIREHEAAVDFGASFIALARAVYRENDERGRIKQALNRLLHSPLVEEKQYPRY